jgi:hypothetical protein
MTGISLDALVASPHWVLMRGMVLFCPGARPADMRATVVKGDADCIEGEDPVCYENGITRFKWNPLDGWLPDIDDPANHGHMLGLVRKAWGADCRVEVTIEDDGSADVSIYRRADGRVSCVHVSRRDTLGQALAAALLAAPAKAGES